MKKLFFFLLLIVSINSFAQPTGFTPISNKYQWLSGYFTTGFAVPKDTFAVTGAMQSYPWVAEKGAFMYRWSTTALVWKKIGDAVGAIEWGDLTGTLSNQTDLQAALDAKEDLLPTGGLVTQYISGSKTLRLFSDEVLLTTEPLYLKLEDTRDSVISIGDPRYQRKRDSIYYDPPLYEIYVNDTVNKLIVDVDAQLYNARNLMGRPLETGAPSNGDTIIWDEASGEWVYGPASNPIAMAAYREDDRVIRAIERLYDLIKKQQKEIEELKGKIK